MAGRRQQVPGQFAAVYEDYAATLARAPLDADTRRAYDSRVRGFLAWLAPADLGPGDPLADPHARDLAVGDYRAYLKTVAMRPASTVNAHLTALDHFYEGLGLGRVRVRRDQLPRRAPRSLDARQQKRYLRAAGRRPLSRDRAIGRLLFYTGLRVSELVALDVDDLPLSARKGKVIVRHGKGGNSREIPLVDLGACAALADWKAGRDGWPGADTPALFLNRRGGRLSARAVGLLLDDLAADAGLVEGNGGKPVVSPHAVRHTFGTNLIRGGTDIFVVAELMGHHNLQTTRLYALPTEADVEAAVARLPTSQ